MENMYKDSSSGEAQWSFQELSDSLTIWTSTTEDFKQKIEKKNLRKVETREKKRIKLTFAKNSRTVSRDKKK